jgi:phage terminase large subunit-like protein
MWDLSCVDWEDRIREGRSLIPDLPLIEPEADMGLQFYDELQLPDVPGTPKLRTASGQWFRDIVRAGFGSWDAAAQIRYIREIFAMAPKGSSKTSYSAALMLCVMLMNRRPRADALFVGPTQAISDRAYEQAVGMRDASRELRNRFRPRDHIKTIEDLKNGSAMKVKTFDLNILTGSINIFVLLDELHLLGRSAHTTKVLRQIRGGLEKTPEGLLLITTTQSDEPPQGAFKDELKLARKIRDGAFRGKIIRPMLPVLYEFPADIAGDRAQWENPDNWPMVMPNLGKSVQIDSLVRDWQSERDKGEHAIKVWASQHLNIEIGVGISSDGWRGADFWEAAADETLTLESLIDRCDVVTMGTDGGGLDDLLGLAVIGRDKVTREWLAWCHAFADQKVLERRKEIAQALRDFEAEGSLTIGDGQARHSRFVALVAQVVASGLLPAKDAVGVDPNNAAAVFEALEAGGVKPEQIRRLLQGPALAPAMYGLELKLDDGTFWHADQLMMNWVMSNAKVEQRGNHQMITKQISGRAKIDPLIALLEAAILMSWNPAGALDINDFLRNAVMA